MAGRFSRDGAAALELGDGLVLLSLPRRRPSFPEGRLTAAELVVARAVFAGASTEEVARQRGVRPKTVSNQLHAIYRKLGVTSRAEMVARYATE